MWIAPSNFATLYDFSPEKITNIPEIASKIMYILCSLLYTSYELIFFYVYCFSSSLLTGFCDCNLLFVWSRWTYQFFY